MAVKWNRRWAAADGLACGAAVLLLAGCATPAPGPASGTETPGSTPTATAAATPPATPTAPTTSTPASHAPTDAAGPGACTPDQMALTLQSRPQDSGAGNFYWDLRLTNTGEMECTVDGYPVTTLVGAATGDPVGADSGTEPGRWYPVTVVPLAPGASAYSLLHLGQAGAYNCALVPVGSLDVTVPGWETARRVPTPNPIEGCDDDSTVLVRTGPLAPDPVMF